MLGLFIGDGYDIRGNSYCSPRRSKTFSTLSEATRQCIGDISCTMVYNSKGKGKKFALCDEGAEINTSTTGSILYIIRSEYICMCTPFRKVCDHNIGTFIYFSSYLIIYQTFIFICKSK